MTFPRILSLGLLLSLPTINQAATSGDVNQGILTLPEVQVVTEPLTFAATLRQVSGAGEPLQFELDTLTMVNNSQPYYSPLTQILYIPTLTLKNKSYHEVQMQLLPSSTPQAQLRFQMIAGEEEQDALKMVSATLETQPVSVEGDAADDPAIWIHPVDTALSTIIGTQKPAGLGVYDLTGKEIQHLDDNFNNVDLRYQFPLGADRIDIVTVSNRSQQSIAIYRVNPHTRHLENVAARTITVPFKETIYGLCMYHSVKTGKYYVFVNDKTGTVEQWELLDNGAGQVEANLVRELKVASQVEGCVADDQLGYFYLGEEGLGIWKFAAEPGESSQGYLIDTISKGHLTRQVEGLALYYANATEGYLIASNQGNSTFTVYQRAGNNQYVGRFQIATNSDLNIDGVNDTDGIEIVNIPLGKDFPYGVLVAQDGENTEPDDNQNFKLVPWEQLATAFNLTMESNYNPRP